MCCSKLNRFLLHTYLLCVGNVRLFAKDTMLWLIVPYFCMMFYTGLFCLFALPYLLCVYVTTKVNFQYQIVRLYYKAMLLLTRSSIFLHFFNSENSFDTVYDGSVRFV